jgi:hypothetical protein
MSSTTTTTTFDRDKVIDVLRQSYAACEALETQVAEGRPQLDDVADLLGPAVGLWSPDLLPR